MGTEATVGGWCGMFRARLERAGELWFGYGATEAAARADLVANAEFTYGKAV